MLNNDDNEEEIPIEDKVDEEEELETPLEYNITSSPNDFNVKTLFDLIESDIIKIPSFQRNFVWDIKRASKLIESIIMGLPIPQLFFYEEEKNKFSVIDGQQRLMTLYYFIKGRFPKKEKRYELRKIFDSQGKIPASILSDNTYFQNFVLKLKELVPDKSNRLNDFGYDNLRTDDKQTFNLRTIRSIIIRQHEPKGDKSSMYEIFYRLNTGGMNLKPQEIRTSLYHSKFYSRLSKMNLDVRWRKLINRERPDLHMNDIEIILRGFAILIDGDNYKPSMVRFLNKFSQEAKSYKKEKIDYLENLFYALLDKINGTKIYISDMSKFNVSMFESVFRAFCKSSYDKGNFELAEIDLSKIETLRTDNSFREASLQQTTNRSNVENRIKRTKEILLD